MRAQDQVLDDETRGAFEARARRRGDLDGLLLINRQLRLRRSTLGTLRTDRFRRLGRLLHPARFDRRPAGPALEASDLIAQRGIRSLQLRHLLKQFDHQALQLGMGQAIKIDRRRHAQNESDSRRRGNLIIIPPWVLPLLRYSPLSLSKLSTFSLYPLPLRHDNPRNP